MSSTVEMVAIGDCAVRDSFESLAWSGVSTAPGATALNRICCFRVFHREVSGDGFKAAFRDHGKRGGNASNGVVSERCSNGDDAAAGVLCQHLLNRKLRDVNEAFEIGRNESAKVVCRITGELLHQENTGIRDDGIDRAELLDREFCNFLRRLKLADVAVDQGEVVGS